MLPSQSSQCARLIFLDGAFSRHRRKSRPKVLLNLLHGILVISAFEWPERHSGESKGTRKSMHILNGTKTVIACGIMGVCALFLNLNLRTAIWADGDEPSLRQTESAKIEVLRQKVNWVYKTIGFLRWPNEDLLSKEKFAIAVVGTIPFEKDLIAATKKKQVKGRPIEIVMLTTANTDERYDLLYIFDNADLTVARTLCNHFSDKPVLVWRSTNRIELPNTSMAYFEHEGALKIEVDLADLKKHGLNIDPTFLNLDAVKVTSSEANDEPKTD